MGTTMMYVCMYVGMYVCITLAWTGAPCASKVCVYVTMCLTPSVPSHFLGKSPIQVLGLGTELRRVTPDPVTKICMR